MDKNSSLDIVWKLIIVFGLFIFKKILNYNIYYYYMDSSKLKKYYCTFIKEYKEPINKYNIFSYSLFYISKYIHFYKDFSSEQQKKFLYNLTLNIQNLERGFFGNNWYIRIFYDKNLFKFKIGTKKPWYEFITKYKNCDRVQFIEFKCIQFENK